MGKKQLTEEQKDFWDMLTSDMEEYHERKIMSEIMENLHSRPDLIVTAERTQGFHVMEEQIAKHYGLHRVSIAKDYQTMSYVVTIQFASGRLQRSHINEEIIAYGIHSRSDRR